MAGYYARHTGEDADDLLQEAWQGLLEALPELDLTIGNPAHYLVARARWRLLDAARRAVLRRRVPREALGEDRDIHLEDTPGAIDVADFLGSLSQRHRELLVCLLEGLTWREAAAKLGYSSANVAYHLRQIREAYLARYPELREPHAA